MRTSLAAEECLARLGSLRDHPRRGWDGPPEAMVYKRSALSTEDRHTGRAFTSAPTDSENVCGCVKRSRDREGAAVRGMMNRFLTGAALMRRETESAGSGRQACLGVSCPDSVG